MGRAATGADDDTVDVAPARTISTAAVTTMTSSQALRDVLTRLPVTQAKDIDLLLPYRSQHRT